MLVTHDQAEALSMGREVGVLQAGRLVQTASPTMLYREPANLDVARFVGEAVVLPGHASAGVVSCPLGDLPLIDRQIEGTVETMIRPEQIEIRCASPGPAGTLSHGQGAIATVIARSFYGPDTVVRLALDGVPGQLNARTLGHDAPEPGEHVELTVAGPVMAYPASDALHDHPSSQADALDAGRAAQR